MNSETPTPGPATAPPSKLKKTIQRFGVAGFLFFLIKGLLWLIIPLVIAMGWWGGN